MIEIFSYKALIFDLGGVIINIDYQRPIKAFEALGVSNFKTHYSKQGQSNLFDDLETGRISGVQFIKGIKENLGLTHLSDQIILNAWNSILLDFPAQRLTLLQNLSKNQRLFLLSNTNEIHVKAFHEILYQSHGFKNLNSFFERVYFSHEIGLRKPNPEIFNWVLKQNNLKAEETFFIDDSIQHVLAAQKLGIHTHHLKDSEDIVTLFQ